MTAKVDPIDRLYVDSRGDIWLKEADDCWYWLRENYYETRWHFEFGYEKPRSPVVPLRAHVRGIRRPT